MKKVAVVDDEVYALERFERQLKEFDNICLCGLFSGGDELLGYLEKEKLDAVFLDIEMPGMNGIELSAEVQNMDPEINIIFVTAYQQYAVEAFEQNAIDYLLKPVSRDRLGITIHRIAGVSGTERAEAKAESKADREVKTYIQCFCEFVVYVNDRVLVWKNSKAKEILAYLVHKQGVPQNWQKIASVIWPEFDKKKAHTNFHATMYLLRKILAEEGISHILESVHGNYSIHKDSVSCDSYRFDKLSVKVLYGTATAYEIQDLKRLHTGAYMEEMGYEWAYPQAAKYEQIILKVQKEK